MWPFCHAVTNGDGDRCAGVDYSLTADQAVSLLQEIARTSESRVRSVSLEER